MYCITYRAALFDAYVLRPGLSRPAVVSSTHTVYSAANLSRKSLRVFTSKYIKTTTGCEALGIENAAQLSPSGFVDEDTEVTVTCLEGHGLNGTGVITCQSDGFWSTVPRCGKP